MKWGMVKYRVMVGITYGYKGEGTVSPVSPAGVIKPTRPSGE